MKFLFFFVIIIVNNINTYNMTETQKIINSQFNNNLYINIKLSRH